MTDRSAAELVGDLDGPAALVDCGGGVAPLDAMWRINWAVGAEDRWHLASEEKAVRSRLVDGMPVVETAMRVPGGDVVLRTAAVRDVSGRAVVMEFVNATPTPVSLALAVEGDLKHAAVRGCRLLADGEPALELPRAPGGSVAATVGDLWDAVRAGPPPGDCDARSRSRRAAAAVLIPLATSVPLRAVAPLGSAPRRAVSSGGGGSAGLLRRASVEVCSPGQAVDGWLAVVARAAGVQLPDETAERAWRRGIAAAVVAAGGVEPMAAARAATVLDRVGLPDEADRGREVLWAAAERSRLSEAAAVAGLRALASRRLRAGRVSGLAELAGPLVAAAGCSLDVHTLEQTAAALEPEAPAAARDACQLLSETAVPDSGQRLRSASYRSAAGLQFGTAVPDSGLLPAGAAGGVSECVAGPPLTAAGDAAGGGGVLAAVLRSAAFGGDGLCGVEALLDCLVYEGAGRLVMAPCLPREWIGSPIDVVSLGTRHGRLSFSLRWHGSRPAVLWEIAHSGTSGAGDDPHVRDQVEVLHPNAHSGISGVGDDPHGVSVGCVSVSVECGLDPSWRTALRAGEALLGL